MSRFRKAFQWGADDGKQSAAELGGIDWRAAGAECIGLTFLVIFGCGVAVANGAFDASERLMVSFAFGMSIMVLVYSIAHHSGGQINPAVTFSLVLGGRVTPLQGLANLAGQVLGSMLGASVLWGIFPCDQDQTGNLASNIVNSDYGNAKTIFAEFVGTSLLCYVIWETAVSPKSTCGNNAIIAIGFAVFVAHMLLIPIDGCSINPARSFGPAVISYLRDCPNQEANGLKDMWIMTVGPLAGGAFGALLALPMGANPWLFDFDDVVPFPSDDKALELEGEGLPADANVELPVEANSNPEFDFNPGAVRAEPTT